MTLGDIAVNNRVRS